MPTDDDYEIISTPSDDDYEIIAPAEQFGPPVAPNDDYGPPLPPYQPPPVIRPEPPGQEYDAMGAPVTTDNYVYTDEQKQKADNQVDALVRGGGQGVSFGNSDELVGGAEALWHLAHGSSKEGFSELYKKYRDEQRIKNAAAETNNPYLYGGSKAVGTVASSLLLPGGVASAGLQGVAQGIGESTAEDIGGLARDAAVGGVVGTTVGSALPLAGKAISKAGTGLRNLAEDAAESAAGGAVVGAGKFPQGTGRELLERKIVPFWGTSKTIAQRAESASQDANKAVQTALDDAGRTPELANSFKENKRLAGMLDQVVPAAQAKANQGASPVDKLIGATTGLGAVGGGLAHSLSSGNLYGAAAGLTTAGLGKLALPRAAASSAAGADWVGQILQKSPEVFGKYAAPLIGAASRGGTSLASNIFVLQSKDSQFRQLYQQIQEIIDAQRAESNEQE